MAIHNVGVCIKMKVKIINKIIEKMDIEMHLNPTLRIAPIVWHLH